MCFYYRLSTKVIFFLLFFVKEITSALAFSYLYFFCMLIGKEKMLVVNFSLLLCEINRLTCYPKKKLDSPVFASVTFSSACSLVNKRCQLFLIATWECRDISVGNMVQAVLGCCTMVRSS